MIALALVGALLIAGHPSHSVKDRIRACTAEQIDICGDLICEGDLDFDSVIAGTGWAIEYCFEPDYELDEEYFDEDRQRELFRCTIYDNTPTPWSHCDETSEASD